ncbi:MAG: nuoM [Verrucomicrobiales bacterium]|nr:nuoM [Verrucomicrobiales bacterium]
MSPLTYIFGLPLLTALVIVLIPRSYKVVIRGLALLGSFIAMCGAICVFVNFNSAPVENGFRYVQKIPWVESLGISYHVGVDGINLGLILMGAVVSFAAVCISNHIKTREKEFYILLLIMSGGILGAFASLDMFFLYFLHELALVPTFIMIGVWGRGENKNYATFQITLYLSLGALLLLIGLIALYLQMPVDVRTFDIIEMTRYFKANSMAGNAQHLIFPFLLFGFGILVSLWPFHTWAPLGYASAPPATAMIHAGVLKKFGLYGLIRIALPMMPGEAHNWMTLLSWLCVGNILWCGLVAIRQRDLNMLIGNSSVAHMGFAFLGIASLNLIGITGTVLIMVAHGLLAALTFALSGYIANQIHSTKIEDMGGLLRAMPYIGTVMIMAMLAGCGLPGFASFPGETLVLFGSWSKFQLITGLAIWGALVIAGVYMLRAIRNVWHGDRKWTDVSDAKSLWRKMPYALLLAGLIIFGCFPRLLTDNIKKSLPDLLPSETMVAQIQK